MFSKCLSKLIIQVLILSLISANLSEETSLECQQNCPNYLDLLSEGYADVCAHLTIGACHMMSCPEELHEHQDDDDANMHSFCFLPYNSITCIVACTIFLAIIAMERASNAKAEASTTNSDKSITVYYESQSKLDAATIQEFEKEEDMLIKDCLQGLSIGEICEYEKLHACKLRELGYQLLDYLNDLELENVYSMKMRPSHVLTNTAMAIVLEREFKLIDFGVNRDKLLLHEDNFNVHHDNFKLANSSTEYDQHGFRFLYDLMRHTRESDW